MKNLFKKIMTVVCVSVMLSSLFTVTAGAANVGDVVGYSQPTDIVATINGYQLESYNVDGYTYICVEDLQYYGFDVRFDFNAKTLSFSRNDEITVIDPQNTNPKFWSIGSNQNHNNILYTDIITYANEEYVAGCNINGQTLINFNELQRFGAVSYDNDRREISLVMDDVNYNLLAKFASIMTDETNKEYSSDWKILYRAKGDVFVLIGTSRSYCDEEEKYNFITDAIPEDKNNAKKLLNTIKEYEIPISSVYVEYRNNDGSLITAYQVY